VGRGCSLEILSEMSERDYRNARGFLGRAWMRFRINIVFPLRVALRVIRRRGAQRRVLMLTSTPFTIPAVASLLKRRGDTLCQMLYDLYPDALVVAGKVGPGSLPACGYRPHCRDRNAAFAMSRSFLGNVCAPTPTRPTGPAALGRDSDWD